VRDSVAFLKEKMQENPQLKTALAKNAQIPEGVTDFINARFGVYIKGGDI
jgi:hypothetical protein